MFVCFLLRCVKKLDPVNAMKDKKNIESVRRILQGEEYGVFQGRGALKTQKTFGGS